MYTNIFLYDNFLYERGIENGKRYTKSIAFKPTAWVHSKLNEKSELWHTLFNEPVYPIQFETINHFSQFINNYSSKDIQVYQSPGHIYQYIAETYQEQSFLTTNDISTFIIDIETSTESGFPNLETANEEILLISIRSLESNTVITWASKTINIAIDSEYRAFSTEIEMLKDFIAWWSNNYPDVVTGWNSKFFDLPYLYRRLNKLFDELVANQLSPFGICKLVEAFPIGRQSKSSKVVISGIADLDYLELYKKFTYSMQESYKLDYIAIQEIGAKKLENPGSTFKDFYTDYWDTFVQYNIIDTELVLKIDQKMKLIDLALTLSYAAKINYEDVFSPVKTWDVIIYNFLNKNKIVIPIKTHKQKEGQYQGGYVKEPLIGKHQWCCSFDVNSLYPMIMVQYNMSPETIAPEHFEITVNELLDNPQKINKYKQFIDKKNYALSANGVCFKKDRKGILPSLVQYYYDMRVVTKKEMLKIKQQLESSNDERQDLESKIASLNNQQMAYKILLNSLYGACGTPYFRYFDTRIAEGITLSGQLSIRWIENRLNQFLKQLMKDDKDRVVLVDTDSVVITMDDFVKQVYKDKQLSSEQITKSIEKVANQKLQKVIETGFIDLFNLMNAYEQKMVMKLENVIDVMITVSKKRYVMSVHISEGIQYKSPKLKIMGLQVIKTSTPYVIRNKLKDSLPIALYQTEKDIQDYVSAFEDEFNSFTAEEIAFPRSVSDIDKFMNKSTIYGKGTPIHVRGSLLYNWYIKKLKLENKYRLIQSGDKIKFLYLKMPNIIHEDCIAFIDKLPVEFKLKEYIDYKTMFEKTFFDPVQDIIQSLNWSAKKQSTLENFFS